VRYERKRHSEPEEEAVISAPGLGCAKTKTELVLMPSGRRISAFFFVLRMTAELRIPGAVIPRSVFTQARSIAAYPRMLACLLSLIADIALAWRE
jgi:hypothetical protein